MPSPISQDSIAAKAYAVVAASQSKLDAFRSYQASPEAAAARQESQIAMSDSAWSQGVHNATSSFKQAINAVTGDARASAEQAQSDAQYTTANPNSVASDRLSAAYDNGVDAQGNKNTFAAAGHGIVDTIKTIYNDVTEAPDFMSGLGAGIDDAKALGGGIVKQIPNSIAPMAGMALGATIGAPLGAVGLAAGLWGGATLGNMSSGQSELIQGLADKQGIDLLNPAQSEKFFEDNRGELLKENFIKSGVIGAVDTATIGLGGALLNAPLRTATENVLAKRMAPSDLLNPKLVSDVLAKPAIKEEIASDINLLASRTLLGKVKSAATGIGLEMGSEGLGEYAGQYAATGVADPKSAVLEGLSSLGQATGTHMAVRSMNGAKDTAVAAKDAVVNRYSTTKEDQQNPTTIQEQEQQRQAHMDHVINTGDVSNYVGPQSTQNPVDGVISLAERIKNADKYVDSTNPDMNTTEKVVDDAHTKSEQILKAAKDTLEASELALKPEEIKVKIANLENYLAGYIAAPTTKETTEIIKEISEKMLPLRQAQYDVASKLSNTQKEEIQRNIDTQKTNLANLSTQHDLLKQSVITDVAKEELVNSLGTSPTAVPEIMRHAMKKRFDTKTLDLIDNLNTKAQEDLGSGYFTDQEVGTLRSLKLSMRNQTMDEVNDNIRTGMDKHWSMPAYYNAFTKAVETGNRETIDTLKPQLANWDKGLRAKNIAVQEAAAEYIAKVTKYLPTGVSYDDSTLHHTAKSTAEENVTPIVLARDATDNTKWERQEYNPNIDYKALGALVIYGKTLQKDKSTGLSLVDQISKDATDVAEFHAATTKMLTPSKSPTTPTQDNIQYDDSIDAQSANEESIVSNTSSEFTIQPAPTATESTVIDEGSNTSAPTQQIVEAPVVAATQTPSPTITEPVTPATLNTQKEAKPKSKDKLIPMDELNQRQQGELEALVQAQPADFEKQMAALEETHRIERENNQSAEITGLTLGNRRNENTTDLRQRNRTSDHVKQKFGTRLLNTVVDALKSITTPRHITEAAKIEDITETQIDSFNKFKEHLMPAIKGKLEEHLNRIGLKNVNGSIIHDVQIGSKRGSKKGLRNAKDLPRDYSLDIFHVDSSGMVTMDENTATAFTAAVYSEILGISSMHPTNKAINKVLGRGKDVVPNSLRNLFPYAVSTRDRTAHSIGKTITDLLGLEDSSLTTSRNHLNSLRSALGARAIAVMNDLGYIQESSMSEYDINIKTNKNYYKITTKALIDKDKEKIHRFISLKQSSMGLNTEPNSILQDSMDSGRFIVSFFDIQREADTVHTKPASYTPTSKVPEVLTPTLEAEAKTPYIVDSKAITIFRLFDRDNIESMAGIVPTSDPTNPNRVLLHSDLEKAAIAQNNSIKMHIDNFFGFLDGEVSLEAIQVYFLREMYKQQRNGIVNQIVNPQADKFVRWFITNESWKSEIKFTDINAIEQFDLAVATAFDLKTTKELYEKLNSPNSILQRAVNILVSSLDKGVNSDIPLEDQKIVVEAVQSVGTNMHAYSGLMALAQRQLAESRGEPSFVSTISAEADGKTNGVAITSFLFGTHNDTATLLEFAKKYGIYTKADGHTFFDDAKEALKFDDVYMTIARSVIETLTQQSKQNLTYKEYGENKTIEALTVRKALAAIQHFTTQLKTDEGGPSSIMREMVKEPILMLFFGSSIPTATAEAADVFLKEVKQFISKSYQDGLIDETSEKYSEKAKQNIIGYLNKLINFHDQTKTIPPNTSGLTLMGWKQLNKDVYIDQSIFTEDVNDAIMRTHTALVGDAIAGALTDTFDIFIEKAAEFNKAVQVNGEIFQLIREEMIKKETEKRVQMFLESGGIVGIPSQYSGSLEDTVGKKYQPLESISKEAIETVDALLLKAGIMPMLHSDMSSQNPNNIEAGIVLAKQQNKPSDDSNAKFEVITDPIQQMEGRDQFKEGKVGRFSPMVSKYESLGIGGVSRVTHSTEAAIMNLALTKMRANKIIAINVFDAIISGALTLQEATKYLNEAFFEVTARYSPIRELYNTTERMFIGLSSLDLNPDTLIAINKIITSKGYGNVSEIFTSLNTLATKADQIKLGALLQVGALNQYSLKGSEYVPTGEDRDKLQELLDNASKHPNISAPVKTALTTLGMSKEQSFLLDSILREDEKGNQQIDTSDVIIALRSVLQQGSQGLFKSSILARIEHLVSDVKIVLLNTEKDLKERGMNQTDVGQFESVGSNRTIYLVKPNLLSHTDLTTVLLHEFIHAALSKVVTLIETGNLTDARAVAAYNTLKALITRIQLTNKPAAAKYSEALKNVHEFIAYGLSDEEFQNEVLIHTPGIKKGVSIWDTVFQKFVNALTQMLGFKSAATAKGLGTLIRESVALIRIANEFHTEATSTNQTHSMKAKNYTTEDTYDALTGDNISSDFNKHLKGLLTTIVDRLHGPFGILHSQIKDNISATNSWKENITPLTNELVSSGLVVNDKQAFVMEQIYATVVKLNSDNEIHTFKPYGELSALYTSVFKTITVSDFLGSTFGTTTQAEAQSLYDLVFKTSNVSSKRSDYLARFVALGLTNPGINALLEQHTESTKSKETKTWAQKLQGFFEDILSYIHSWSDSSGSPIQSRVSGKRLEALVTQLVKLELKQVQVIKRNQKYQDSGMRTIEAGINKFTEKYVNKTVVDLVDSDSFQKIRFKMIKGMGALAKTAAGHKFESFLEHTLGVLHLADNGKLGLIAGLINNVKGQKELFELLLLATAHNDNIRKTLMTHVAKNMLLAFKNQGKNLTIPQKNAITAVLLKTNVHTLVSTYSLQDLHEMLTDSSKLEQHLVTEANQLTGVDPAVLAQFIENAHELGYYAATGKNTSEMLKTNIYQIINSFGEGNNRLTQTQLDKVEPIVSNLASLYALKYTTENDKQAVAGILQGENERPDEEGNGIEFVLKFHEHMANVEKEYIYDSNPALASFGSIHEIFNPRTKLIAANLKDSKVLIDAGYIQGDQIKRDPHDPDQSAKHYYILKYDTLGTYVSGAIQFGSDKKADDELIKGPIDIDSNEGRMNAAVHAKVNSDRAKTKPVRYSNKDHFRDMSKDPEVNYMAPIFDAGGQVLNWTYLMSENTKNNVLQRTNSFEKVLGTLAGSLQGKQNTVQQNEQVLTVLFDEYQSTPAYKLSEFILVGPNATDKESREQWARLPDKTKASARKIFGSDHIMVSKYSIDMILGYRKVSMADPIHRLNKERAFAAEAGKSTKMVDMKSVSEIQKIGIMFIEEMLELSAKARGKSPDEAKRYARRAAMLVTKAEGVWQEVVSDLKDKIVVVSGSVLVGNIFSNVSRLVLEGIPLKNIAHYSLVAFKGATQYLKDKEELDGLLLQVKLGYDSPAIQKQINILEDAIERNPTTKLIEVGLLPTIVEDLDADTEYEYKSLLNDHIDKLSKNIPEPALNALKTLMMSRESGAYKALAHVTQMSDFVARYTMYQFQTTKAEPMSHIDAVARANNAFVQYAMPMQRMMQYSDDMGFTLFTKYFLYIQREMARLYKEQPGRVLSMAIFDKFINLGPTFIESSFIDHIGNWPFRDGALEWLNLHDKLLTTKALAAVL